MKRYLLINLLIAIAIISLSGVFARLGNTAASTAKAKPASAPAVGDIVEDPSSGTRILRVTDASDAAQPLVTFSNCASFNQDSTRFVVSLDGVATLYSFDPARLTAQKEGPLFDSMKLQFDSSFWSATDPETLIGLSDSDGVPQIYSYNVRTRSFTLLKDFEGILPEGVSAKLTKSSTSDDQFVFSWRDSLAVVWQHVVLWDRNLDSTYLFDLNDPAMGVTGYREAYLDEQSESLIVVGDTTRAWRFRAQPQSDAAEVDSRSLDGAGLQASLATVYRDGAETGEALSFDWQEGAAAIFPTSKHVYVGVRPGATRGARWASLANSAVYYTQLAGEEFKGALGFVTWRGHELTARESAMLGPGEWHLDAATSRLYVRLPDDSSPLAENAPVVGELSAHDDGVLRLAKNARGNAERLSGADSSRWERLSQLRGNLSRDKRFFIFNSGLKGSRSDVFIAALNLEVGMDSVVWTNTINCTAVSNSVQKTAGVDQVDDASATSMQTITSGDGFVEFTATDTDKERTCGLNNSNAIHKSASDINFAIKMSKKKKAWIIEDGVIRAKLKYKKNSSFRIAVEGNKIKYYKDGAVVHTSLSAPVYPLMINASLTNTNSSVSNVMIAGAGFGIVVSISPAKATLQPGGTQQFTARVTGAAAGNVTWTASGGAITSTGFYTAPSTPGFYTVSVTSVANPASVAHAAVTVGQGADTTPPTISAVSASGITANGVSVSWNTNEPGDTEVEYGLTTAYGESTTRNPALVTSHSVVLGGLPSNTLIHYRVKSRDAAGNLAVSGNFSFTTAGGGDATPPSISNVASSNVTASGATITWGTNEASDTLVEYGQTTSYGGASPLNTSMVTTHSVTLTGLTAS
ncbi:MAG TPA: fibronectin type III domain-containing protein, partial [Blastocatellia bacterium]|nr:fibronectin type III domain-containing protein [Blastocatellia bacterium]